MSSQNFTQNFGQPPLQGADECLVNSRWLYGLSGGVNYTYANGIVAAGTTQSGSTPLPANTRLILVGTVGSGAGVSLPFALAGTAISIYNNGANTLTVYPAINNNPKTGAQDTIDNTTSVSIGVHAHGFFFCPQNGIWAE